MVSVCPCAAAPTIAIWQINMRRMIVPYAATQLGIMALLICGFGIQWKAAGDNVDETEFRVRGGDGVPAAVRFSLRQQQLPDHQESGGEHGVVWVKGRAPKGSE